jgi:hypothetical protein
MKPSRTSCVAALRSSIVVADDLELDPGGVEGLAGEVGGEDGVAGRVAAGRVGQEESSSSAEGAEEGGLVGFGRIDAAHRHGDDLGTRGLDGAHERVEAPIPARSHEEARGEAAPCDDEPLVGWLKRRERVSGSCGFHGGVRRSGLGGGAIPCRHGACNPARQAALGRRDLNFADRGSIPRP